MPEWVVLANANAGKVSDAVVGAVARELGPRSAVDVAVTTDERQVDAVLDRRGDRPLVVVGGDGSMHVACNALWRRGELARVPVGFVPAGTANSFGRGVGLPLAAGEAARRCRAGTPHSMDVIEGDGRVAVNDVHTGLGVPATRLARRLKRWLGPATYPLANAAVGLRARGWHIEVRVDGSPLCDSGEPLLAVAVGNTEIIGGGSPMWPGARPDDGLFDVIVLLAGPVRRRLGLGVAIQSGRHLDRADARLVRGRSVTISGEVPGYNADGEVTASTSPTTWNLRPAAWNLIL